MPVLFFLAAGCLLTKRQEREYLSNQSALEAAAKAARYEVDPALYRLVGVEAHEDSITFQYRGVKMIGDSAWVVRFSQKSTEQNPEALSDLYSLLPLLQEGRTGFSVVEEGENRVAGNKARFIRYRFDSPVSDADARPFPGHGIIANLRLTQDDKVILYQVKLDNHGDREDVVWDDLKPFWAPLSA